MILFPQKGITPKKISLTLEAVRKELDPKANFFDFILFRLFFIFYGNYIREIYKKSKETFQFYFTSPHPIALAALIKFLPYNKNNIGTHSRIKSPKNLAAIEKEVVLMLSDLLGNKDGDGYITQGGTEGNIMGMWIGRNKLRKNYRDRIVLLKSSLTHYSIEKAADILNLNDIYDIPLNENYGMDVEILKEKIEKISLDGIKKFIIILTLGYNSTGTIDPINEINALILNLIKSLNIEVYIHLDAAIGGLTYPFAHLNPYDFHNETIESISLDLRKTGLLPNTAGIFLSRKGLQTWVSRNVPYLPQKKDDTLSGSRPGAIAASAWALINLLGKEGFKQIIEQEMILKNYFIKKVNDKQIAETIISNPDIPIVAISVTRNYEFEFEKKFDSMSFYLDINGGRKKFYKFVFMPHNTINAIDLMIDDLNNHT